MRGERVIEEQMPGVLPVTYAYDSRGRLTAVQQGNRRTTKTYDSLGRETTTDPIGQTLSMSYDSAHRVSSIGLPDANAVGFERDAAGNLTSLTPPGRPGHFFEYTSMDLESRYSPPEVDSGPADTTRTRRSSTLDCHCATYPKRCMEMVEAVCD